MTTCTLCKSGRYTHVSHDKTECRACSSLDAVRKYDTRGMSGQSQCWPVPLDCLPSQWGGWGSCSHSCHPRGASVPPQRLRHRAPARQPAQGACGVSPGDCSAAWGGGKACSDFSWVDSQQCNAQACPVDCSFTAWSPWEPCSATCGSGISSRIRAVTVPASAGGVACPHLRETQSCNSHPCAPSALPACHNRHVRCHLQKISHHNSLEMRPGLPFCGLSAIDTADAPTCVNGHKCGERGVSGCCLHEKDEFNQCHAPDTAEERALRDRLISQRAECLKKNAHGLAKRECGVKHQGNLFFNTIVVTHDKLHFHVEGDFHCQRDTSSSTSCSCTCNKHPECCAAKGKKLAGGAELFGNSLINVESRQECCNLCVNHPHCRGFELVGTQCTLKGGSLTYVNSADVTAWAGVPKPVVGGCS